MLKINKNITLITYALLGLCIFNLSKNLIFNNLIFWVVLFFISYLFSNFISIKILNNVNGIAK